MLLCFIRKATVVLRGGILTISLLGILFAACNGIFDDIYDSAADDVDDALPYGYAKIDADGRGGRLFVDATSYTRWTYFNLRRQESAVIDFSSRTMAEAMAWLEKERFGDGQQSVEAWDLAVHRSVPKTNHGCVAETRYGSILEFTTACTLAGGVDALIAIEHLAFEADTWSDQIAALDLTGIMTGEIIYQPTYYNAVLNRWLNVDISLPPPSYSMSGRVFLLQLVSGEYFALRLADFRNGKGVAAWLTIEYVWL